MAEWNNIPESIVTYCVYIGQPFKPRGGTMVWGKRSSRPQHIKSNLGWISIHLNCISNLHVRVSHRSTFFWCGFKFIVGGQAKKGLKPVHVHLFKLVGKGKMVDPNLHAFCHFNPNKPGLSITQHFKKFFNESTDNIIIIIPRWLWFYQRGCHVNTPHWILNLNGNRQVNNF